MKTPAEKKELKAIARFYKDCKHGFATNDGYYGVPSNGKKMKVFDSTWRIDHINRLLWPDTMPTSKNHVFVKW